MDDLFGQSFLLPPDQDPHKKPRATVIKKIEELDQDSANRGEHIKFLLKLNNQEDVEQVITYNQLLDYLEKDESQLMEDAYWSFKDIIAHQGPLTKEDPHYKGSSYNVMIKWDTGQTSYESLSLIIQDDPITCAVYVKEHGLLDTPGWKHLKKYVKTSKRLLRAAKQFKIRQARKAIKYQSGYQVPRNYEDALRLDMENENHKWQDVVDVEMAQIKEYGVFKDYRKAE